MTPIIQFGQLNTNLDVNGFTLLNVLGFDPLPPGLVSSSDPRLTDDRVPLDGSVVNASVSDTAAIVQSKLSLNGNLPTAWIGTTSTTAARGDLAEYLANKGQPNGYASLDGGGKIPAGQVPAAVGTGTITSLGLSMPAQFTVSGSPITTAGSLSASWNAVADGSWFGNKEGGSATPRFYTTALPTSLIPPLDASIITSGTLAAARLPVAVGLGGSHAPGAVPDPGAGGGGAAATDYLARDMTYKAAPTLGAAYQPTLANPSFSDTTNPTGPRTVVVNNAQADSIIFVSTTGAGTGFSELGVAGSYTSVPATDSIWVYAARAGFNNSSVVSYTNPNP